ncbi:DNA-processing protein DprA [Marinimicrobium alkaliphilum]|uniref:DNA-processing protein DprA n=1 Tax=Marinimicrobium alkaliphilum TaxID=2202654 RepID=UPI000DB9F9F5|nr:DNA-processing protein DprA [Marinimicrobium alkaliphilum]
MYASLQAVLLLQRLPGLGASAFAKFLEQFPHPEHCLERPLAELSGHLSPEALSALGAYRDNPKTSPLGQRLEEDLAWLDRHPRVSVVVKGDPDYPPLLAEIRRAPPVLFVLGNINALSLPQLALVGSRNPTAGGRENAWQFAHYLAGCGFAITSGLALGVDGVAHQGALDAGGKTLAIMGTGIDQVYPSRHKSLAADIVEQGGALVSEFPIGTRSQPANFPQRNRLISGLSLGTLVVEAAVKSGSLITARYALQQNREVFAIPGSIHNPLARGCHQLLRDGATLIETGQDVVDQLAGLLAYQTELFAATPEPAPGNAPVLDQEEQQLLTHLGYDPVDIDTLVVRTALDPGTLLAQLMGLELKGAISERGGCYVRVA